MRASKTGPWVLGTAFAAILVLVGAWLLLHLSALRRRRQTRGQQAVNEQARIDQLRIQLAALKTDYDKLDTSRRTSPSLQIQIPTAARAGRADPAARQLWPTQPACPCRA